MKPHDEAGMMIRRMVPRPWWGPQGSPLAQSKARQVEVERLR